MNERYRAFLAERREQILDVVARAAAVSGRTSSDVTVEAVSKTVGPEQARDAWAAGWRVFAENRPQEVVRKLAAFEAWPEMAGVRLDMIGNLQTNKINQVLGRVALIHSISSERLAGAVSRRAEARGLAVPVLLEVNVSGEASKSGFAPAEAREAAERLAALPGIEVRGLMTMAPADDPDAARRTFSGLRELRDELRVRTGIALDTLSAGMSDDFPLAIEEGSTLVRLGRVVFQEEHRLHPYNH